MIEDADEKFWRVQCKTAWLESDENTLRFAVASLPCHTKAERTSHGCQDYHGQVDYFAVYSPDTGKVYLVPISHVGKTEMKLRLVVPKKY